MVQFHLGAHFIHNLAYMAISPPPIRPSGTVGIGGSLGRPSTPAAPKGLTSISQMHESSHIYQVGDSTSMHGASDSAGSHAIGSIAQTLKKGGLGGAVKPSGGTRPIMPLLK